MPELPKKKVGLIACSGEEIPEGTITRLAVRQVLESLRPEQTVTICLPLFLAGGEGDRAFARFHPTITVDGCAKRCAARGTEMYSGKPAVSIVVSDSACPNSATLGSARRLSEVGRQAVSDVADQIAGRVDHLLDLKWDRRSGGPLDGSSTQEESKPPQVSCSCGSGVSSQTLRIGGREVTLNVLPLIFGQFREAGKLPDDETKAELMRAAKIYNLIPDEEVSAYAETIMQEYAAFCRRSN
jgi:uncharacterized metal-binding protein